MNSLEITSAMAEVEEVEGSGLMEDREESLEHVQQWDEDVVDLEFKSGHKTPFLGQFNLDGRYFDEILFHLLIYTVILTQFSSSR